MTVSAFDHPWLSGLFGDDTVAELFSAERTAESFLRFERALTKALGDHGVVDKSVADGVLDKLAGFSPDMDGIAAAMAKDGVPGPAFVKQLKQAVGENLAAGLHVGATSQDLSDTALVETLGAVNEILSQRLRDAAVEPGMRGIEPKAVEVDGHIGRNRAACQFAVPRRIEAVALQGA